MKIKTYLSNRPHTTTKMCDIKRMFKKHPVKTTFALPIATVALGGQMILYFVTVPFVAFNNVIGHI